jgi:hypothetical protein
VNKGGSVVFVLSAVGVRDRRLQEGYRYAVMVVERCRCGDSLMAPPVDRRPERGGGTAQSSGEITLLPLQAAQVEHTEQKRFDAKVVPCHGGGGGFEPPRATAGRRFSPRLFLAGLASRQKEVGLMRVSAVYLLYYAFPTEDPRFGLGPPPKRSLGAPEPTTQRAPSCPTGFPGSFVFAPGGPWLFAPGRRSFGLGWRSFGEGAPHPFSWGDPHFAALVLAVNHYRYPGSHSMPPVPIQRCQGGCRVESTHSPPEEQRGEITASVNLGKHETAPLPPEEEKEGPASRSVIPARACRSSLYHDSRRSGAASECLFLLPLTWAWAEGAGGWSKRSSCDHTRF